MVLRGPAQRGGCCGQARRRAWSGEASECGRAGVLAGPVAGAKNAGGEWEDEVKRREGSGVFEATEGEGKRDNF